tara:strand:+ start:3077 stop:3718 length:642 start_codon:yes stop_codon:yes gene_type:complete
MFKNKKKYLDELNEKKLQEKLDNIKYPLDLPGSYKFENERECFKCIQSNHGLLNTNGSFNSSYPSGDPYCQELAAAINLYLFNLDNKDSERLNNIKRKYVYYQSRLYLNNSFGEIIKSNNIPSLKELSRIVIRKSVANHLGLLRINSPRYPVFKPLLEYNLEYKLEYNLENNKNYISWKPKIILNLKIIGKYLPKILSEYIEAPNLPKIKYIY